MNSEVSKTAGTTFTHSEITTLYILSQLSTCIGLAASASVIVTYCISRRFRQSVIPRISVAIALADLLAAVAQNFGSFGPEQGPYSLICQSQAALQMFGELASCLLIFCVGVNVILLTHGSTTLEAVKAYDSFYIPMSYAAAMVLSIWPLFQMLEDNHPAYGATLLWCFVRPQGRMITWILFGPLILTFVFGLTVLLLVKVAELSQKRFNERIKQYHSDWDHRDSTLYFLPSTVALYMLSFIMSWSVVITLFILGQFYQNQFTYTFNVLLAICVPLRGLWNSLAAFYQYLRDRNNELDNGVGFSFP